MGNPYTDLQPSTDGAGIVEGSHVYFPDPDSGGLRMPIKGRGKLKCVALIQDDNSITLRVDDEERPEFWAEVPLTKTFIDLWEAACEIKRMIAGVQERRREAKDGDPQI